MKKIKGLIIPIIIVVVIIVVVMLVGPGALNRGRLGKNTVNKSTLQKIIKTEKLSSAQYTYNGIAEHKNEDNKIDCYITYESTIKAGLEIDEITFSIDKDKKVISISLPEIKMEDPSIDVGSLSYIPRNPKNISMKEIITLCEEDIKNETEKKAELEKIAEDNAKKIITSLLTPLLTENEYELAWD